MRSDPAGDEEGQQYRSESHCQGEADPRHRKGADVSRLLGALAQDQGLWPMALFQAMAVAPVWIGVRKEKAAPGAPK